MPKEEKPKDRKATTAKQATAGKAAGPKAAATKPAAVKPAGQARAKPAAKKLDRVPDQYVFYCCDGNVYRDMADLAAGLAMMSDATFAYHSNRERQDFCNWVRDIIEDIELAEDLAMAESRDLAATCVAERIAYLSE